MKKEYYFSPRALKSKWTQILLGLFWVALIFWADVIQIPLLSSFITQLDYRTYDQVAQLNWRPHQTIPRVVIIDIDNKSVQQEGRWPWPRTKMADLINKLKQSGVVTIATDIVMAEAEVNYAIGLKDELIKLMPQLSPEQKQLPNLLEQVAPKVDNDRILAQALMDHNVVLGFLFHNDKQIRKGVLPTPLTNPENKYLCRDHLPLYQFSGYNGCLPLFLNASTQAGAVTNVPDLDGTVRHGLMLASYDNKLYPTLSLATAMNYLMVQHISLKTHAHQLYGIQMGNVFIPTNAHGQILIPFWGQIGTLNYYSATDVIQGKINADELQGAIAIIGSTIILLADLHQSPVAQSFPGVEMVGNMVQGIVGQQLVSEFDWKTTQGRVYLVLFGLFFTFLISFLSVSRMLILAVIGIIGIRALSIYLFVSKSFYLPIALMLTLIVLITITNYAYLFIVERRQKRKINQLFGQYVPEDYVKELIESPDQYSMEGQERNMTVLFSDIRNFTGVSETLNASDVKRLLNAFFTPITEIIFSFRGTIDKYVGDMIVAFWGAPIHDEEHAFHAITCALTLAKQLPEINVTMEEKGLPAVKIGIGLATGMMNVGDMGSAFRRAYTVIGDTVNLASRLQDLTKFYQVTILVSDGTRSGQDQFVWRIIDKITVKGRKSGLIIYQPLCTVSEASDEVLTELDEYHKALVEYSAQNWPSAEKKFARLKTKFPGVYLYQMYHERIKAFMKTPPPENWDGVYMHQHK
ncbi:adenylate/guanylate cyclase transmembrane protein [Legionella steigerwaltii]|uniref:Adenylate/guanylate cyclase transmembrane protein n=1 Tax=Legionella steigerwaltii TaxID=460 RepID=A0A378L558_9GAMM|nr:adenylate/guanylate cyclase domain-containing protein [Legionella steigerwaltii]KTD72144.1 adenylate/guanylate cyclase transmembrane protein [Legionella steigerwaltii]STY21904.1 adenylate/guanylate cyclase transmembrane protein [Legionella steigerwaltii]